MRTVPPFLRIHELRSYSDSVYHFGDNMRTLESLPLPLQLEGPGWMKIFGQLESLCKSAGAWDTVSRHTSVRETHTDDGIPAPSGVNEFDTLRIPSRAGNPGLKWGSLSMSWPLWNFHSWRIPKTPLAVLPAKSLPNWRQVTLLFDSSFLYHWSWKSFVHACGIFLQWRHQRTTAADCPQLILASNPVTQSAEGFQWLLKFPVPHFWGCMTAGR